MGARGPGAPQHWLDSRFPDFWELVDGPEDEEDAGRIEVLRHRWKAGGERAVMSSWDEPGSRPWAWWRFSCPVKQRHRAESYRCDAEALLELNLCSPEERQAIIERSIVKKQLAELASEHGEEPGPLPPCSSKDCRRTSLIGLAGGFRLENSKLEKRLMKPSEPPPLTDSEWDVAFRESATDEEIEAALRDLRFWSYILRDPFGKVCAAGRGTRADCIRYAFQLGDEHAIECFSLLENERDETRALNGAWRLVIWPPKLDPDPRFFAASSGVFNEPSCP
jgi:hypothetical protein